MTPSRSRRHERGRGDELAAARDRERIAQGAARLIAEHGLTDWALAKRKAARQLLLPDGAPMPSNEEVEQALASYHALFGGEAHAEELHAQRTEALAWMRRLSAWEPLLVGGVAEGWATRHSDIRLELVADDPKAVEMALAGNGVDYVAVPARDGVERSGAELFVAASPSGLRLSIVPPQQRRNRPRHDDETRLGPPALQALLAAPAA
jgi:hypothetical protein